MCGNTIHFKFYRDGILYKNGIEFRRIAATRIRSERCCTAWHIEGIHDTLTEVGFSQWVEEIRSDTQKLWRDKWEMHHYMIYLDSAGCFEVIAESWQSLTDEVSPS